MKKQLLVVAIMVIGLAGPGEATIVELDLLSLGCPTEFNISQQYWQKDFDLGVEFIEITNVYIDWSGSIVAGLAIDPLMPDPQPFPLQAGIYAYLGDFRTTHVWGGETTYPNPEPFDSLSEFESLLGTTWSDLLDGQGTITIGYEEAIMLSATYIEHGSIDLSSATLVVEGTVIPEPATLLFLGIGAITLCVKKTNSVGVTAILGA